MLLCRLGQDISSLRYTDSFFLKEGGSLCIKRSPALFPFENPNMLWTLQDKANCRGAHSFSFLGSWLLFKCVVNRSKYKEQIGLDVVVLPVKEVQHQEVPRVPEWSYSLSSKYVSFFLRGNQKPSSYFSEWAHPGPGLYPPHHAIIWLSGQKS